MKQSETDMMRLNKDNLRKYHTHADFGDGNYIAWMLKMVDAIVVGIILRLGLAQKSVILGTSDRANSGANEIIICSYLICGEVKKL